MSELSQNGSFGHIHLKNINLHLGQDKQRFQALDHVSACLGRLVVVNPLYSVHWQDICRLVLARCC